MDMCLRISHGSAGRPPEFQSRKVSYCNNGKERDGTILRTDRIRFCFLLHNAISHTDVETQDSPGQHSSLKS